MNIHGSTELNTSYKHFQFTLRIEGVAEHLDPDMPVRKGKTIACPQILDLDKNIW